MLLKWIFTVLALLWLYQALRPYFFPQVGKSAGPPPPPPQNSVQKRRFDDEDGEYVDYEEIKK
jgi:hypothetical protein